MCETGKLFFEEAGTKMYLSRGEEDDFLIQSILEKYHFDRESLDRRVIRDISR